ncbi:MAG: hypothetical protein KKB25_00410 [Nanoarchaeota archaeon]|nr:hypothetical protein [Nanoarchaeota archaeon]
MEKKNYLRMALALLMLYFFYQAGIPILFLPPIGIILVLLIFLKGTFYKSVDEFLVKKIPFAGRLPSLCRKLLVIAIFILIYVLVKQAVFEILSLGGIDVQQMIMESINQSLS